MAWWSIRCAVTRTDALSHAQMRFARSEDQDMVAGNERFGG